MITKGVILTCFLLLTSLFAASTVTAATDQECVANPITRWYFCCGDNSDHKCWGTIDETSSWQQCGAIGGEYWLGPAYDNACIKTFYDGLDGQNCWDYVDNELGIPTGGQTGIGVVTLQGYNTGTGNFETTPDGSGSGAVYKNTPGQITCTDTSTPLTVCIDEDDELLSGDNVVVVLNVDTSYAQVEIGDSVVLDFRNINEDQCIFTEGDDYLGDNLILDIEIEQGIGRQLEVGDNTVLDIIFSTSLPQEQQSDLGAIQLFDQYCYEYKEEGNNIILEGQLHVNLPFCFMEVGGSTVINLCDELPACTPFNLTRDAVCGPANGTATYEAPTSNLCTIGSPQPISGTGPWSWNCTGRYGGADAACAAPLKQDGVCGPSDGGVFASVPSSDLCINGTPTIPTGIGPWAWNCTGINAGLNDSCSAAIQDGISVELLTPTTPIGIVQNSSFQVTANVTCFGTCGQINASLYYRDGGNILAQPGTAIANMTANPLQITLADQEHLVVTYQLNATGSVGSALSFYVEGEIISAGITNVSGDGAVSISGGSGPVCGDGNPEGTEQCDDGNNILTDACDTYAGTPLTRGQCSLTYCGDGVLQPTNGEAATEACDLGALNGVPNSGCSVTCAIEPVCGDGVAQGTEVCDGSDLRAETCGSQGFLGGILTCDASCALNTSACTSVVTGCADGERQFCGNMASTNACDQGVQVCSGGTWGACARNTPISEVCGDGIDNNCEGRIDEGCARLPQTKEAVVIRDTHWCGQADNVCPEMFEGADGLQVSCAAFPDPDCPDDTHWLGLAFVAPAEDSPIQQANNPQATVTTREHYGPATYTAAFVVEGDTAASSETRITLRDGFEGRLERVLFDSQELLVCTGNKAPVPCFEIKGNVIHVYHPLSIHTIVAQFDLTGTATLLFIMILLGVLVPVLIIHYVRTHYFNHFPLHVGLLKNRLFTPSRKYDKLKSYIEEAEKHGHSRAKIFATLEKQGWKTGVIDLVLHDLHEEQDVEKLEKYVRTSIGKGRSRREITDLLMDHGWEKAKIDKAFRKVME